MGRTRLRGIELAGVRLAIEVSSSLDWRWPENELAALACSPLAPDMYVGVRVGRGEAPDWDPISYAFADGSFDVGRVGDDWLVVTHGRRRRCERVARFDADLRVGEVIIAPELAAARSFPLEQPLLDILLLHRVIRDGGLLVAGTPVIRDGRALVFLGADAPPDSPGRGRVAWQEARPPRPPSILGERLVLRPLNDAIRVHGLPGGEDALGGGLSAPLEAIHVVERSQTIHAQRLAHESAVGELLQYVFAPVHDPDCTARLIEVASDIAARVPVLKLARPEQKRALPFAWGQRQAALALASPALG